VIAGSVGDGDGDFGRSRHLIPSITNEQIIAQRKDLPRKKPVGTTYGDAGADWVAGTEGSVFLAAGCEKN